MILARLYNLYQKWSIHRRSHHVTHWGHDKWPSFCRWYLKMQFFVWKLLYFDENLSENCSTGPVHAMPALMQLMAWRQDIIWTNVGLVYRHTYASLDHNQPHFIESASHSVNSNFTQSTQRLNIQESNHNNWFYWLTFRGIFHITKMSRSSTWFRTWIINEIHIKPRFPRHWPFVRGIHLSSKDSPHKGQWRGALMSFFSICAWTNVEQTIETAVIWDASAVIITSL